MKTAKKSVSTSFRVRAARKSWSQYTTASMFWLCTNQSDEIWYPILCSGYLPNAELQKPYNYFIFLSTYTELYWFKTKLQDKLVLLVPHNIDDWLHSPTLIYSLPRRTKTRVFSIFFAIMHILWLTNIETKTNHFNFAT